MAFAPEVTTLATVSPRALVRLEGAVYSVPSRWAGLDLVIASARPSVTLTAATARAICFRLDQPLDELTAADAEKSP